MVLMGFLGYMWDTTGDACGHDPQPSGDTRPAARPPAGGGAHPVKSAAVAVRYPPGNFSPGSFQDVGFLDLTGRDYRLSPSSPFHRAGTDGRDIGADLDALSAALQAAQGRDPGRIANPGRGEGPPGGPVHET